MAQVKKGEFKLRLQCGHEIVCDSRPNPRKVWPDPQTCPVEDKKKRVVEIHSLTPVVRHTTSPLAPVIKKKRRSKKK